ncbi:MAG: YqeG family HAD IIIA-type phosphatase, partial [Ruminococcaceae bacterium]|nr:YqeG family HAD IIIA-type phosphatase [Oscillospiraceae bacterium]
MAFIPDYYFEKIEDITPEILKKLGVLGLVLDIDNTLTYDFCPDVSDAVLSWLSSVKDAGIKAVIVSNNSEKRAEPFAQKCGLPFVARAKKPGGHSL